MTPPKRRPPASAATPAAPPDGSQITEHPSSYGGETAASSATIEGNYVRLYRSLLDSDVFADPGLLKVFVWALLRASWCARSVPVQTGRGSTVKTLKPGQFIFGRKTAAAALGMPESTVVGRMNRLQAVGTIHIEPDTHFSIVTLVNWSIYQPRATKRQHPTKQVEATPNQQATDTNKNQKKDKKVSDQMDADRKRSDQGSPDGKCAAVTRKLLRLLGDPQDAALVQRVGWLVASGHLSEHHAVDAAQGVCRAAKRPSNPIGYFRRTLEASLGGNGQLKTLLNKAGEPPELPSKADGAIPLPRLRQPAGEDQNARRLRDLRQLMAMEVDADE